MQFKPSIHIAYKQHSDNAPRDNMPGVTRHTGTTSLCMRRKKAPYLEAACSRISNRLEHSSSSKYRSKQLDTLGLRQTWLARATWLALAPSSMRGGACACAPNLAPHLSL